MYSSVYLSRYIISNNNIYKHGVRLNNHMQVQSNDVCDGKAIIIIII